MWYGRASTSRQARSSRAHHSSTSRDFLRSRSLNSRSARYAASTALAVSSDVSSEKTRLRGSTPSAPNRPTQNWCVDQTFRARGMPTRSLDRDGAGAAERVLPNQLGNVRVVTLDVLQPGFDLAHLVHVLDQSLGARVATDHPLPARGERDLAPLAARCAGQLHVDERAGAVDRAPLADGIGTRRARVAERRNRSEAAEARRSARSEERRVGKESIDR